MRNDGEERARVAIFSSKPTLAAAVYPDSAKLGVLSEEGRFLVRSEPQLDYWDGEPEAGEKAVQDSSAADQS